MKINKKTFKLFSLLFCSLFSVICYLSCEQPFKAGLGPIIDLQNPTIVLDSPSPGIFIRGEKEFTGHANDDYKLESVWFLVSSHPNATFEGLSKLPATHPMSGMGNFYKMKPIPNNDRDWTWKFTIDTMKKDDDGERVFQDGILLLRLMAIDHMGKYVVTDEIVFNIKNNPPLINVAYPLIQEGEENDGDLGSDHLNFNFINNLPQRPTPFTRTVEPETALSGSISDYQGIYRGEATGELFPPQIRFWEVYFDNVWPTDNKTGAPVDKAYPAGEIPTLDEIPWMSFKDVGDLDDVGGGGLSFRYPIPDASGHYYAFEIRAQSVDSEHSSFRYPRDYYVDFDAKSPDFKLENSYALVYVSEYKEDPVLSRYDLEDIWGEDGFTGRTGGIATYKDIVLPPEFDKTDKNYPYIAYEDVAVKNGAFILRMKASHSGGISSARVYWEKSGSTEKGRFIWDPVEKPFSTWPGVIPYKSDHYSRWGLNEPDGVTTVRNFVFTYTGKNPKGATDATAKDDRLPNTAEFQNNVSGNIGNMSKVQRFIGGNNPKDGKPYASLNELPDDLDKWQNVFKLDEGKYNIYVYATSNSGAVSKPYRVELTIDRGKPSILLNYIEGSAGEKKNEKGERENTVNGVIKPWLLFSDSRPTDTGFRDGTSKYFEKATGVYYQEQAYILIPESDRDTMDKYFKLGAYLDTEKNIWPDFTAKTPSGLPGAPVIPGVTVSKHGVVIDSACLFRTSKNYHINPLPTPNPDIDDPYLEDGPYQLYVFARDNAFNVGSVSYPIIVDKKTDIPTFDFSVGSINTGVTEPDSAYDINGSKYTGELPYERSFIAKNGSRNMFTANSGIQVRIKDDDGLNLGVSGGAASGIEVTFVGSRPNPANDWIIEAYDNPIYKMTLGDTAVKQAFPPDTDPLVYVKDIRGNITYNMLLDLLKANPNYAFPAATDRSTATTIPDGIYRVGISIKDYSPAKLVMKPDFALTTDPPAHEVTVNEWPVPIPAVVPAPEQEYADHFWIAVDNNYPVIDLDPTGYNGGIIQPGEKKDLKGTVSDENGPITLVNWLVKNGNRPVTQMSDTTFPPDKPRIEDNSGNPLNPMNPTFTWANRNYNVTNGKWEYEFNFKLAMYGDEPGTYDFELTFKDRFGKEATVSLRSMVDNEPPKLTLIKKIETFQRVVDDVTLTGVKVSDDDTNKERLAVKVVNFSINATDNNGIKGVRWWLLPADTGSKIGAFDTSGEVLDYDAFPAKELPDVPGVYYGNTVTTVPAFNKGVYGVMDAATRKFTVAFDSRKLPSPNGEYRLHIIAMDTAGNPSRVSNSPASNMVQEVFFLQIEDKPYLDKGITPGEALPNGQLGWPQEDGKDKEMPVLGASGATIRGTVWENNGFFGDGALVDFWPKTGTAVPGSVTIWFSPTGGDLPANWETTVQSNGGDITSPDGSKYVKKIVTNADLDKDISLKMQGRNISMTMMLSKLFPNEFKNIQDGKKRYIIRVEDSPVNKLKEESYPGTWNSLDGNATRMGIGQTAGEDQGIREYNYRQYAFVYDALNPKVFIDTPVKKPVQTYGRSFADTFILGGYISDANLEKTADGDYFFDYYLNSNEKKTFILKPRTGVDLNNPTSVDINGLPLPTKPVDSALVEGQHIYAITKDPNGKITVYFRIKASEVTKETTGIIPAVEFLALPDTTHTLTLWASDKSGKEGVDFVDFIKDTEPPKITFTNLDTDNRPYDGTNKSKVGSWSPVDSWWARDRAARQTALFGASALPLTTLSYTTGVPELRGTISDLVSNIELKTINSGPSTNKLDGHDGSAIFASDVGTGDINKSDSVFRYWIDNEQVTMPTGRFLAVIDGNNTKNVRWTINLTEDGTKKGTPLCDGVHTIMLTAADSALEEIPLTARYMIAFRIDSKAPRSKVSVSGASSDIVYGHVNYQNPGSTTSIFTLTVAGDDANLKEVKLRIKNMTTNSEQPEVLFDTGGTGWTYYPAGSESPLNPALPSPFPLAPEYPAPGLPLAEDYILFNMTYPVPKTLFTASGKYNVIVAAWDHAKNKSEEFIFSFTYDIDSPKIEYTNPSDENKTDIGTANTLKPENFIYLADPSLAPNPKTLPTGEDNKYYHATNYANINRLISENLRIQGNVKDTFSPVRDVQSRVERWDWLTGAWIQVEDWKSLRDYSDNTQTQISWTKNLLGQNNTLTTPNVDLDLRSDKADITTAEGLYRIRIRARDSSYIPTPPPAANQGTTNWDNPVGSGNAAANGIGNPVFSDYQYFYFDRTNPVLEITSINGSTTAMDQYYSNPGKFTFKGRVTDNNRFAKVEVKFEIGTVGMPGYQVLPIKEATLTALAAGDPGYVAGENPARTINTGGKIQNWSVEFADADKYPDGKYKVTVTVYDMTGRSTSESKSFILDSTPPTVKFTLPAKVQNKGYGDDSENKKPTPAATANGFASVLVPGGPTSVITGETGDKGEPGSQQSGVDQMWFHLGFIDGVTYNASNPFPSKDAIEAWEKTLIERHTGLSAAAVAALTVKQRNDYMDTIAEYRASGDTDNKGNAWFKLGGTRKPVGFVINNPNIYDWRFEIPDKTDAAPIPATDPNYDDHYATMVDGVRLSTGGVQIEGLKLYAGTITVKGRTYTVGNAAARQMVRSIDGQAGGVYRLPLWVRLTDVAGNVEYYCHDIWIDANGSIPSTSIESPSNGTQYNARGGTISVDGVARSNTSVYDVIFRVFADNVADTNLDGIQTNGRPNPANKTIGDPHNLTRRPAAANVVRIIGYDPAEAGTVAKLPADAYYQTSWQKANLTLKGGSGEPVIPWSIMINSEDQIRNLIPSKGFASAGTTNDMIRVWLEVFVFNGEGSPIRSSIYPNDNLGTASYTYTGTNGGHLYGTADTAGGNPGPRPYVRSFYIRTGAAAITHPNVGTWTADYKAPTPAPTPAPFARANFTWNGEDAGKQGGGGYGGSGTEMRSNKFAVSATLDPNPSGTSGSGLGEVAYRIKLDGGSYGSWTTVWKTGDSSYPTLPENVNSNGVRISVRDGGGTAKARYYFDYAINSKSATPPAESGTIFAAVNGGNWANTGGTVTVQIRMKDNSPQPNEAEQTIQVAVDNFAPLTDINYRTNPKVAGSSVNFMGRVYDYATAPAASAMNTEYTPRKLERVSVWFTKGSGANLRYVNLNQKNTTVAAPPSTRTINVFENRAATISGGGIDDAVSGITLTAPGGTVTNNFSYPGLGTQQAYNADYVRDITQATGQPQYKMLWSPVNSAVYDVRWQLTLDSTLLPDGDLTLHYIVVDAAGNASYYTQTGISVRNNYPEITRITLYTDNNGQGAQYTMDAEQGYTLNDYRSRMFANYTDSTDFAVKAKTTGYLNSGFISKNSYLGFKVETDNGNRPLNFRLQHVKRERLELTAATLNQMITDRTAASPTTINLYTIAWHGNYTPQKWRALGVPIDNPTLGTHFVFNPVNIEDPTKAFNVADAVGTAYVWKYTTAAAVTRADITNQGAANSTDTVVYGPASNFDFNGPTHFDAAANTVQTDPVTRIGEYDGSHPTVGDTKADDPDKTAFFLIRVWDSINSNGAGETRVNDQLYDAVVVGLNVYLTDKNNPVARLYDLNPYTETAVIENNKPQTIKDAADPQAIGSNIVRGGLYNDGSARAMVRSGFIDPRGGSTALDPKNGVYFQDQEAGSPWQLINGLSLPDYPNKVSTDTVPASGNDKVSGKIILRGHAWDDQLVNTIALTLPGGSGGTILQLTNGKMAAIGAGIRDGQPVAFAVEELHWKTGHSVEWAYIWDTGTAPATNQTIGVTVTDRNGSRTSASISADGANAFHNTVTVDIVPYITGFERQTPDSLTKRSLQGWYSFYQGETGIKVKGYNFGTTTGGMTLGGTNITPTGTLPTERTFSIPTSGVSSGAITLTTSVAAYNNYTLTDSGITGKSWNREANTYTPGSELWINKPHAHIWRTAQSEGSNSAGTAGTIFATGQSTAGLDSPGMSLQYTASTEGGGIGRLHGVWTTYGRESFFYAQNSADKPSFFNNSITNPTIGNASSGEGAGNPPYRRDGAVLLVKSGEPYSAGDIDYYNNPTSADYRNNISAVAAYQRDGGPWLILKPRLTAIVFNNNNSTDGGGTDGAYSITREQNPLSTYRWRNTRIKKVAVSTSDAHPGKVFVSAYDSTYKRLLFKTVSDTVQPSSGTRDNNGGTEYYLDGGSSAGGVGGIGAATLAGNWVALDYTSGGNPVVAYFDEQHQTLRIAYGNSATPAAGDWTRRYVLPDTNPLYLGSGSYVSMAIDRRAGANQNRIHLAFYNSNQKAVVYATGTINATGFTLISASVVDHVVEGGQWTDISVDNTGNPWIVYADSGRLGDKNGARIAYKGAFTRELKDPISGTAITGWEALTMPSDYQVKDDRLNIAAWPPAGYTGSADNCPIGGWNAAVGYASDLYRIGYFFKPAVPTGF